MWFSAFPFKNYKSKYHLGRNMLKFVVASLQPKMHSKNAFFETPFGRLNNFVKKSRKWPRMGALGFLRSLITIMMSKLPPWPPGAQERRRKSSPWNSHKIHRGKEKHLVPGGFLGRWIQIWHRRTPPDTWCAPTWTWRSSPRLSRHTRKRWTGNR